MDIVFVLPLYQARVSGGFRVVYEYANHLARRGHGVKVILPNPGLRYDGVARYVSIGSAKERIRSVQHRYRVPWFEFDPSVEVIVTASGSPQRLPQADVTIATGWRTAAFVAAAPSRVGSRAYLIQHHETWDGDQAEVDATWTLPLHKIVISRWLQDLAYDKDPGAHVDYIPNGMDLDSFSLQTPIGSRSPFRVGMLFHPSRWKGTDYGVEALKLAKAHEPRLEAVLYGHPRRPPTLPAWIDYRENLAGDALYRYFNEIAIFLHPSLAEGWPLPPAEAMASGAALIAADNPGVLDYARPEETAIVVPRTDVGAMAEAILDLVADSARRQAIASRGNFAMREYTWDRAVSSLEGALERFIASDLSTAKGSV